MTVRYQQESGRDHDPLAPCAQEGCDRQATRYTAWCIRHMPQHQDGTPKRTPPWQCSRDGCEKHKITGLKVCRDHVGRDSGGAGEQAAEVIRQRDSLHAHVQPVWQRIHGEAVGLILELRRHGYGDEADEVTAGLDQIGKALTKACGRDG